jgi:ribonuclease E
MNANAQAEGGSQNGDRTEGANAAPERRERRSRDRYGRDRRERNTTEQDNNNSDSTANDASHTAAAEPSSQTEAPVTRSYFDRAAASEATQAPTLNVAPSQQASAATAPTVSVKQSTAPAGLPKVQTYELPMASLIQVAEGSGLQWVNSDPVKISQVQAAIAAEPHPVHVPRERPPLVVVDEGPLVLVETRKNLSDIKLPF